MPENNKPIDPEDLNKTELMEVINVFTMKRYRGEIGQQRLTLADKIVEKAERQLDKLL